MNENNGIISGLRSVSLSHTVISQHEIGRVTDCKECGTNPLSAMPPLLKHAFYLLVFKFHKTSGQL